MPVSYVSETALSGLKLAIFYKGEPGEANAVRLAGLLNWNKPLDAPTIDRTSADSLRDREAIVGRGSPEITATFMVHTDDTDMIDALNGGTGIFAFCVLKADVDPLSDDIEDTDYLVRYSWYARLAHGESYDARSGDASLPVKFTKTSDYTPAVS